VCYIIRFFAKSNGGVWLPPYPPFIVTPIGAMTLIKHGGKKNMEKSTKSWDGFLGSNFLKVDDVADDQEFAVVNVEISDDDRPRLSLQSNEKTYSYDLNVTDAREMDAQGVKSPQDAVGKKVVFRKTQAYSPTAKKDVPTLRIKSVK